MGHGGGHSHGGHSHGHHGISHHPDQGATWNQAMQGDSFWASVLKIDRRPFMVLSLMFFGAFTWLYILYNIHHSEAVKNHTAFLDLHQRVGGAPAPVPAASAPTPAAAAPVPQSADSEPWRSPLATAQHQPGAGASPAAFGAPRTVYTPMPAGSSAAGPDFNPYGTAGSMPQSAVSPENFMETAATMGGYNYGRQSTGRAGNPYGEPVISPNSASASYGTRGSSQNQKASLGGATNYMPTDHGTRRLVVSR